MILLIKRRSSARPDDHDALDLMAGALYSGQPIFMSNSLSGISCYNISTPKLIANGSNKVGHSSDVARRSSPLGLIKCQEGPVQYRKQFYSLLVRIMYVYCAKMYLDSHCPM